VVAETCTWIRYHDSHAAATDFFRKVDQMVEEDALALLWVDKDVHRQAWEIFERYEDQNLSFLDCTSFVLARRLRVDFVFGFDRDFYVMNFDLRPGPER
jgi:predicted nucleic acid-binding protein